MQLSIVDRLKPFEQSLVQGDPAPIVTEYEKLKNSFEYPSLISTAIHLYSELYPEAVSFHARLLQICSIKSFKYMVSMETRVCLALFINKIVHNVKRTEDQYFKKSRSVRWPLPWGLYYEVDRQSTCVFPKNHHGFREKVIRFPNDSSVDPIIIDTSISLSMMIFKRLEKFPNCTLLDNRISQCSLMSNFRCGLSLESIKIFALFIERVIHKEGRSGDQYFKKTIADYSVPLIYSLQYIAEAKSTYVLIKTHENDILRIESTEKKVTAAIEIPDDRGLPPKLVAQAVNIKGDFFKDILLELEIHKKFSGSKGIWPLRASAMYHKVGRKQDPKISLFSEIGRCADEISKNKIILTIAQHIDMADHITSGVNALHKEGYLQGDLKPQNVLFKILPDTSIVAGLIDFGFSFLVKEGYPDWSDLLNGYYGTIYPTAPELFGVKNFTGDLFKVEIWAQGILLYLLYFKTIPYCASIPDKQWDLTCRQPVDGSVRQGMVEAVKSMSVRREILLAKQNRSLEDDYLLLIYDMLQLEPKKRPDSMSIMERMAQLKLSLLIGQIETISIN